LAIGVGVEGVAGVAGVESVAGFGLAVLLSFFFL
jgi:hypothetical protein